MDLEQLAVYLRRDLREVSKLASRGHLPGKKVGGEWRFASWDINYWLELQLPELSEEQLAALESRGRQGLSDEEPIVTSLLSENTIAVSMHATTKASVLRELVSLAPDRAPAPQVGRR